MQQTTKDLICCHRHVHHHNVLPSILLIHDWAKSNLLDLRTGNPVLMKTIVLLCSPMKKIDLQFEKYAKAGNLIKNLEIFIILLHLRFFLFYFNEHIRRMLQNRKIPISYPQNDRGGWRYFYQTSDISIVCRAVDYARLYKLNQKLCQTIIYSLSIIQQLYRKLTTCISISTCLIWININHHRVAIKLNKGRELSLVRER